MIVFRNLPFRCLPDGLPFLFKPSGATIQIRLQTLPAASATLRFAFGKHVAQPSNVGRIRLAPDSGHFDGNPPVAFAGEQEICCSGRVVRGAEDFVLVFL
jgi:hypothetical protein